jgi:2-oxoisovalerate dehydrogenase E1 component
MQAPGDQRSARHRELLRRAVLIREFETRLLQLFGEGRLNGTVHTCVGQEFVGVALGAALTEADLVVSNHRGHGHYLAVHEDPEGLLAEIMGRVDGVCGGVGGSQHLVGPRFLSNGIQGGMTPIAVGVAEARRRSEIDGIVAVFVGDGTLGEGLLYESLNLASLRGTPVVFVIENNGYAQSTPTRTTIAGSIPGRSAAFGLPHFSADTWNWRELVATAEEVVATVRATGQPAVLEVDTYRLNPHSKGDDTRDPAEVARYREADPLNQLKHGSDPWFEQLCDEARERIDRAVESAERSPDCRYVPRAVKVRETVAWHRPSYPPVRHADRIHAALADALNENERVVLLGEDIEGPYGGAFKVTKGLSQTFPDRVSNVPISEAGIVGLGTGLAYGGYLPVVEIMFGDFLTLTFDQLLQHAAKFRAMFARQAGLPLIVRTPMGGRRGYGPTHSQSIEKFFLGIPGLDVLALNHRCDPGQVYRHLFDSVVDPTLVIENKTVYTRFLDSGATPGFRLSISDERWPTVRLSPVGTPVDVTVVCYGGMLEEAERAQERLFEEHEVAAEIICPTSLHPLNVAPIARSVTSSKRLVAIEEGPDVAGFGAEVVTRLAEERIDFRAARAGYNGIVPASAVRERELLVDADTIVELARGVLRG